MLHVETIVSFPFDENTYVFWLDGRKDSLVVDPGMQPGKILQLLDDRGLSPAATLLTHGHSDHIFGCAAIKDRWPDCPLVIGHGDAYKMTDPKGNLSQDFGMPLVCPPADQTVAEGDSLSFAGLCASVLETPGHSAGHVTFLIEADGLTHVVSGDVLFQGGVGRTDFFDGDAGQLRDSIQQKLFPLPESSVVYPGHGPTTTVGHERRHNPFVGEEASGMLG